MMTLVRTKYIFLPMMVLMLGAPQMAFAQSGTSLSGLYACEQLVGDTAQLACFRAETAKIRTSQGLSEPLAVEKQRLATEREGLALERQRLAAERENLAKAKKPAFNKAFDTKPEAPKSQTLAITNAQTLKGSGYTRFTLANGEVWQQTEAARVRLGRASPDTLVIKKGRIAGYLAKVNDKRPTFRVKRVK